MNNRKAERFDLDLNVNIVVSQSIDHRDVIAAHTKNVSSEGAYLDVSIPLKEGTGVKLELFLTMERLLKLIGENHKVKVKVEGEVVRSDSAGMAIKFNRRYKISTFRKV